MQNNRLEKLLEMQKENPNDLFFEYAIALEYKAIGRIDDAINQFEKSISLDENHIASYYQLGIIFEQKAETEKALKYLTRGFELAKFKNDLKTANEFRTLIDEIEF